MTIKQREYIKALIDEEREYGAFGRADFVIATLGGDNWEDKYELIPNSAVSKAINLLQESIHQNLWALENGY